MEWKIGELAERTGMTVRALRHYEARGLLRPAGRSAAGHRKYGQAELEQLQRIASLRQLGFSLAEIAQCLDRPEFSLRRILQLQLERLDEHIDRQRTLRSRLAALAQLIDERTGASADELFTTIEATVMYEKYYSREQLEQLGRRGDELGPDRMREVQEEWPRLIAAVREEMAKGTEPTAEPMLSYARRWRELIELFTGGDPGIAASLGRMYREEPAAGERAGLDPDVMQYVGRAMAARE